MQIKSLVWLILGYVEYDISAFKDILAYYFESKKYSEVLKNQFYRHCENDTMSFDMLVSYIKTFYNKTLSEHGLNALRTIFRDFVAYEEDVLSFKGKNTNTFTQRVLVLWLIYLFL